MRRLAFVLAAVALAAALGLGCPAHTARAADGVVTVTGKTADGVAYRVDWAPGGFGKDPGFTVVLGDGTPRVAAPFYKDDPVVVRETKVARRTWAVTPGEAYRDDAGRAFTRSDDHVVRAWADVVGPDGKTVGVLVIARHPDAAGVTRAAAAERARATADATLRAAVDLALQGEVKKK